ncbi:MAG: DUF2189 domain-containing protein [Gammaproteobacteria bacterium]|nr:DUF2189 domain-containing protein [Gammaproteobacteria bacterium]
MQHSVTHNDHTLELPEIRQVAVTRPFKWLAQGWRDFRHSPFASGFYGLVFVLLGYALTAATWSSPLLVMTFVTGFLLVAPFFALGLYDLSRQREQNGRHNFRHSLLAFRHNKFDMGLLIVFHALVMIAWIRMSALIGGLYFSRTGGTDVVTALQNLITSGEGFALFGLLLVSGGVLAALVFVSAAVSWPMVLDRNTGVINAMATSIKAVGQNKAAMLVWGALIVALIALGIATLYIGLLFIIPILGHATWHAYRDLVH